LIEEQDTLIQEECLIQSDRAPLPFLEYANSICLLSFHLRKPAKKDPAFGTAFLCHLGEDTNYEVVLVSAGHNFPPYKDVSVGEEGFPYEIYDMTFNNQAGITLEEDLVKESGITHFNLRNFLSKQEFDVKFVYSYCTYKSDKINKEFSDFVGFRLGIEKYEFEKKFGLHCLPISTDTFDTFLHTTIMGHSKKNKGPVKEGDEVPLRFSPGDTENANEVAKRIQQRMTRNFPRGNGEMEYLIEFTNSKRKVFYSNDTLPGFSGAPVLSWCKEVDGSASYKVIGIHNGSIIKIDPPNVNYAHRISHFVECLKKGQSLKLSNDTS